jgi:hypothetical protein
MVLGADGERCLGHGISLFQRCGRGAGQETGQGPAFAAPGAKAGPWVGSFVVDAGKGAAGLADPNPELVPVEYSVSDVVDLWPKFGSLGGAF